MESVLELFARARRQQLSLPALKVALEGVLTRSPQGLSQGLSWLDLAQQREPIPVTEFVTLRQDLADHLRLAKLSRSDDSTRVGIPGETTELQREMTVRRDSPHLPSDATLAASAAALSEATLVASTPPPGGSEATLVASTPPPGGSDATLVASTPPPGGSEATLVASAPPPGATDATLVASTPPPGGSDATLVASPHPETDRRSPEPPTEQPRSTGSAESTLAAPSLDPLAPSAHERRVFSPGMLLAATGLAAAVATVIVFSGRDPAPSEPPASVSAPAATEMVSAMTVAPVTKVAPVGETPHGGSADEQGVPEPVMNTDVDADTPVAVLKLEVEAPRPQKTEPLPSSMEELSVLLDRRIAEGDLDPAMAERSAGHVLEAMIKLRDSDLLVSEGRSKLADAHRLLARKARESGNLDAAQVHMDHAYDVLLMGTD